MNYCCSDTGKSDGGALCVSVVWSVFQLFSFVWERHTPLVSVSPKWEKSPTFFISGHAGNSGDHQILYTNQDTLHLYNVLWRNSTKISKQLQDLIDVDYHFETQTIFYIIDSNTINRTSLITHDVHVSWIHYRPHFTLIDKGWIFCRLKSLRTPEVKTLHSSQKLLASQGFLLKDFSEAFDWYFLSTGCSKSLPLLPGPKVGRPQ